ncbi:MAG TPA: hypothetical protein VFA74_04865 [Terriglobales bacterium]|nr:hypothetical protein [Terriglobales bacterium]
MLVHPEDEPPQQIPCPHFDLIIDFARAPISTYEHWSLRFGCPTISFYDFAKEIEDLHLVKKLLEPGMRVMVDQSGIDWWDVLSLAVLPDLQSMMLIPRLADYLSSDCELFATRPFPLAKCLQHSLGVQLRVIGSRRTAVSRFLRHYSSALSNLNIAQLYQVAQDKFDKRHNIRRHLAARAPSSKKPVFLLPTAYINVSRMAVSIAELLPDHSFLLVCARKSSELKSLPANVRMVSLDAYFAALNKAEIYTLMGDWEILEQRLISRSKIFENAKIAGIFKGIPSLIRWALALRAAWIRVFQAEHVTACLCADDNNPYSRIPLILANQRAIPTIALHHGALDLCMAVKQQCADYYLAKSAMERDYLLNQCKIEQKTVIGPSAIIGSAPTKIANSESDQKCLVFFTEPYHVGSWRHDEVYRELLPHLLALASNYGLKLIFKLHPFESSKAHIRILRKFLPSEDVRRIGVITGPPNSELWRNTRVAITVESTTALECTALGIPVFLCGWLRHHYGGYQGQYARFGFGHILDSVEQLADIPQLLRSQEKAAPVSHESSMTINPQLLRELLTGRCAAREEAVGA